MSVLLPAVASAHFMPQFILLHQLMGEWFHITWKHVTNKALFFQKGKKTAIKSLKVRYLHIHTLSYALWFQDLVQVFCLCIA